MNKLFTLVGLAAMLVVVAACSKKESTPAVGPTLNPPTPNVVPAETAPPANDKSGANIGGAGPAWADLEGTDGKTHSLKDLADAQVVAVVFTCNHCPLAQAYEDRLVKFASRLQRQGRRAGGDQREQSRSGQAAGDEGAGRGKEL